MKINMNVIVMIKVSCMAAIVTAIETPEPSSVLRPRSYNPHPYRGGEYEHSNKVEDSIATNQYKYFENLLNQGPIQFPTNNPPAPKEHPYGKIKERQQQQQPERYSSGSNERQTYSALARTAHKVLNNRLDDPNDYNYDDNHVEGSHLDKKHYAFSYTVKDHASGDDFSHQQQQVNGAVKGSYKVMLPDGRMQVVSYIADDGGYRAEVSYEGPEPNHHHQHHVAATPTPPAVQYVEQHTTPHYDEYHHSTPQYHTTPAPQHVHVVSTAAQPIYDNYEAIQYAAAPQQVSSTAESYYQPEPQHQQQPQHLLNVRVHTYNTAPHKQLLNTKAVPSPAPIHDGGSTALPLQIQSNHLEGPIIVTTPIPQYEDIEVTPRSAYATAAAHPHHQQPAYYDYDYQQEAYVQAPTIKYARSTEQRKRRQQRKSH